jgi:hypothetical protein
MFLAESNRVEFPMKKVLCAAVVLCVTAFPLLAAPDTAYQALRTVSGQRGNDVLKHVIEVEGRGGVPEPLVWRVVLDDPTARGGVRELDVAHGKIIAEHTPVRAYSGSPEGAIIDFSKLNLDSSGAFSVAEREAQKAKVGFDSVDYTLRTGDGPDANPVWVIHIMDTSHHSIGRLSMAADTGALVSSQFGGTETASTYSDVAPPANPPPPAYTAAPPPPPEDYTATDPDHDNLYNPPPGEQPAPRQADDSDTEDTQGLRIGHRIKQVFLNAGQSLKNFVSGDHQ